MCVEWLELKTSHSTKAGDTIELLCVDGQNMINIFYLCAKNRIEWFGVLALIKL